MRAGSLFGLGALIDVRIGVIPVLLMMIAGTYLLTKVDVELGIEQAKVEVPDSDEE